MRLLLLSSLFLSLLFTSAYAQENLPEFGKPDMKELLMKDCEFEPGASAMKILKYEATQLINENDMSIRTETWERIKIFTSTGYKHADIEIPYSKKNKIKKLSAYVYNLDATGKIVTYEISEEEIFTKADKKKKKGSFIFTFPGLMPGSVIEYRYTQTEREVYYHDTKFFQDIIPVDQCVFRIIHPNYMKADLTFMGGEENLESKFFENYPENEKNTQVIIGNKINSFRDEPLMSSVKDNLQYMTQKFVYRADWRDTILKKYPDHNILWIRIASNLLWYTYFGEQIRVKIPGTNSLVDSAKNIESLAGKVEFLYKRIRDKIAWNNESYIYAEDVARTWKSEIGSNAEINLLLLNLLQKAKVSCFPVLVRSREYGKANRFLYTTSQFDNVNVLIFDGNNYYLLDATKKHLPYTVPPLEVLNRDVLLVDNSAAEWITIIDDRPLLKQKISIKASINHSGKIEGEAFVSYFDYLRDFKLTEKEDKQKNKAQEEKDFLNSSTSEIKIDSIIEEPWADELKPLNQRFNFSYHPEKTDDFLFVDPFFLSPFRKNPFTDSLRKTDIDFGSNMDYSIYLHLSIDSALLIESLPEKKTVIASDSSIIFQRQTLKDPENSSIVFKYSFRINRAIYKKEEYLSLHDTFRKIYGAIKEQLILKKK